MKRTLKSVVAATIVLGTVVPSVFAANSNTDGAPTDIAGNQFAGAIATMINEGVMINYAGNKFGPTGPTSRGQAIAYLYNILNNEGVITQDYTGANPYGDEDSYFKKQINDMYLFGYLDGLDFTDKGGHDVIGEGWTTPVTWLSALLCNVAGVSYDNTKAWDAYKVAVTNHWFDNTGYTDGSMPKTGPGGTGYYIDRDQLAQVLENFYATQYPDAFNGVPTSLSVSAKDATTAQGTADALTVSGTDINGNAITVDPSKVTYSVYAADSNTDASNGFVNANGVFTATAPGTYGVTATYGTALQASTKIVVAGAAAGITLGAAANSVVANGASGADKVTLQVVDASGHPVSNFNGTVDVSDSAGWLYNGTANTTALSAVAVTNGQATINVSSPIIPGLSDTITAKNLVPTGAAAALSNVSATLTLNSVAQVATAVKVSAANAVVQDNVATADNVSVQVVDQAGQPMLTGSYPLSISVSGPGSLYNATSYSTAYVGDGQSNNAVVLPVMSVQGQGGQINVSATSTGLTSGSAQINSVLVGVPTALKITPVNGTSVAAGSNLSFTVGAVDANGYPVTLPAGTTAAISGSPAGVTVSTVGADGSFTVSGTTAGSYTVTVSNGSLTGASAQFTVTAGSVAQVALTTPAATVTNKVYVSQGSPSVTFSAQLKDAQGNAVAQANVPVVFHAVYDSHDGSFTFNGAAPDANGDYTVDTNANGVASVTFAGQPVPGDTWNVNVASVNGDSSIKTAAVTVGMVAIPPSSLSISATNVTQANASTNYATAGDVVTYSVYEKDAYGNPYANGDEIQVTLPAGLTAVNGLTADVAGNNYVTIGSNGSATFTVTAQTAGGQTVTVKDLSNAVTNLTASETEVVTAGKFAGTASFYTNGAAVSTTNALTVAANTPVAVLLVPTDGHGNLAVSNSDTVFNVSDTADGGVFRLTPNGADVSTVTIPAGSAGITVYYVNANAGTFSGMTATK